MPAQTADARRDRILEAALHLFLRSGFRGTSMEGVASEAGMAKATLYAQFPDKEAVFAAVLGRVLEELRQAFETALAREGPVPQRIAAAIAAKHLYLRRELEHSPHVQELYGEQSRLAGPQLAAFEADLTERLATVLMERLDLDGARHLASILSAAADGVAKRSRDEAALEANVQLVVQKLLA